MKFLAGLLCGTYWGRKGGRFPDRARLEEWQRARLSRMLRNVRSRSDFYRSAADAPVLERFPLLDKQTLMGNFDAINTAGLRLEAALPLARRAEAERDFAPTLGGVTIGLSTGTSGRQGLFAVSAFERGFWAGYILRRMLPRGLLGTARVALFLRSGSNLYASVSRGRIRFRYFDLKRPMPELLARLRAFGPTVVVAPPAVLKILAEAWEELGVRPQWIVSAADVLETAEEARLQARFGRPIQQIYQATEGLLALTCASGRIHLNEDLVYFEWQDLGQERRAPIITDLRPRSVPLVRYRLGDVLRLSDERCPCGSPFQVVSSIEGRMDQLLLGESRTAVGWRPLFPDYVRQVMSARLDAARRESEFKVVQTSPAAIAVALETGADDLDLREAIRGGIAGLFDEMECHVPAIDFISWESSDPDRKKQRVVRAFPMPESSQLGARPT